MRTDVGRVAGHEKPTPLQQYGAAVEAFQNALTDLVDAAAVLGESVGAEPVELLELNRLSLHVHVDRASDEVVLQYPPPGRVVARSSRYLELLDAARERGAQRA